MTDFYFSSWESHFNALTLKIEIGVFIIVWQKPVIKKSTARFQRLPTVFLHTLAPTVLYVCKALATKELCNLTIQVPTLQNNEPHPQVIETGCKIVKLVFKFACLFSVLLE